MQFQTLNTENINSVNLITVWYLNAELHAVLKLLISIFKMNILIAICIFAWFLIHHSFEQVDIFIILKIVMQKQMPFPWVWFQELNFMMLIVKHRVNIDKGEKSYYL